MYTIIIEYMYSAFYILLLSKGLFRLVGEGQDPNSSRIHCGLADIKYIYYRFQFNLNKIVFSNKIAIIMNNGNKIQLHYLFFQRHINKVFYSEVRTRGVRTLMTRVNEMHLQLNFLHLCNYQKFRDFLITCLIPNINTLRKKIFFSKSRADQFAKYLNLLQNHRDIILLSRAPNNGLN